VTGYHVRDYSLDPLPMLFVLMNNPPNGLTMPRRSFVVSASAGLAAVAALGRHASAQPLAENTLRPEPRRIRFCLNSSTIRGQNLTLPEQIRVCAEAGYDAIEPWMRDLYDFVEKGGKLTDVKKQLDDVGLTVESAIGFAKWIVDDAAERKAGLEEARRDMDTLAQIGGLRIAAPPIGAHTEAGPSLDVIARRYHDLLKVGKQAGVVPQLELWGFSKTLSRLAELAYVATAAEDDDACVLPDFYHIYKGGSQFAGLGMIEATRMHVFHMNDYPDHPPRDTIQDAQRVFPGDGVCPLPETIAMLIRAGFTGVFSLELFNPEYWKRDALEVAHEGLTKSKAVVDQAIALV
jgi:2-keto-myo-inositol isomerase